MPTFADAKNQVAQLVDRFTLNAPNSEAAVRLQFIDPFFEALGWDVRNVAGHAEQYKDVVVEAAVMVGTATKAPDYSFRVGGVRKFFVEAKTPSVSVKGDPHPAYQLRRYAWSAKLPLSILTDFEEFAVYDCTKRPKPTDKASTGRILYFTFDEYPKKLRDIYDIFARESILKGSFDRYAEKARGTAEVDAEFLKEIEGWRNVLARNLALRNRRLDIDGLNEAVQKIIDRIVFLRMAEDRGIESQGRLLALINAPRIYTRFGKLCENADAKYNSGLFDFKADNWTLDLKVDDKVLKPIIQGIYYPDSPYEFSVIPPEILGNVYEQFLGKVIRLTTGHQAKVEEKPEVKKAGGVYYTPKYIVDYIVEHTVGELIKDYCGIAEEEASPRSAGILPVLESESDHGQDGRATKKRHTKRRTSPLPKHFHVLDPACGSGSFLLGAYQYLLDHCLKWYVAHDPEKRKKQVYRVRSTGIPPVKGDAGILPACPEGVSPSWKTSPFPSVEWRLTTAERKRILTDHIYGVDIDRQAVEVTKLSLLLKVLEGETADTLGRQMQLFRERALPNLSDNIKCGNSLIGWDYFDGRLPETITDDERRRVNPFDWEAEFPDVFSTTKGTKRTKRARKSGFDAVIGNPPYGAILSEKDRTYVAQKWTTALPVKDMYVAFMEAAFSRLGRGGLLGYIVPSAWLGGPRYRELRRFLTAKQVRTIISLPFDVFSQAYVDTVIAVVRHAPVAQDHRVSTYAFAKRANLASLDIAADEYQSPLQSAWASLRDCKFVLDEGVLLVAESTAGNCSRTWGDVVEMKRGVLPSAETLSDEPQGDDWHPYFEGNIYRYTTIFKAKRYVEFGQRLRECPKDFSWFERHRVVLRRLVSRARRLMASTLQGTVVTNKNLYVIRPIQRAAEPHFVLGLLNSALISYLYLGQVTQAHKDDFPQVTIKDVLGLPFPAHCEAQHERMVVLVERMLALHKQLHAAKKDRDKELLQRQIDATDRKIDQLVYKLYGLTDKEIRIVEEAT